MDVVILSVLSGGWFLFPGIVRQLDELCLKRNSKNTVAPITAMDTHWPNISSVGQHRGRLRSGNSEVVVVVTLFPIKTHTYTHIYIYIYTHIYIYIYIYNIFTIVDTQNYRMRCVSGRQKKCYQQFCRAIARPGPEEMTHWYSNGCFKESIVSKGFNIIWSLILLWIISGYMSFHEMYVNDILPSYGIRSLRISFHNFATLILAALSPRIILVYLVLFDVIHCGYAFSGNISQIFLGVYLFVHRLQVTICHICINHLSLRYSSAYAIY